MNEEKDKNLKLKVWEEFCNSLKKSGSIILNEKDIDELDMVEGWRYLTRLTRLGLEMALENNNPYFPSFYSLSHETAKIGADNPDNIYLNASIDGNCDYRIWGTRGTVHYLSFGTKSNKYDQDGTMETTGELDSKDIKIENDGSFQILLSKNKKPDNWLSLKENTNMVIVRQTFLDRKQEEASNLNIECLNSPTSPEALNLEFVTQSLQKVSAFVEGTASTFVKWTNIFKQEPNSLPLQDQSMYQSAGGDPNIYYLHGYWHLEENEALVIKTGVPDCEYWNFQLDNYWMESLDYRYHRISLNNKSAVLEKNKELKIIISATNPNMNNWIETAGHNHGTMLLRWVNASSYPEPTTEIQRVEDLKND